MRNVVDSRSRRGRAAALVAWAFVAGCGGGGGGGGGGPPPAQPPSALSYSTPQAHIVDTPIAALVPTVTGTVTSYAVAPPLPAGLSLDSTTGRITGTPTSITAAASYTVTATNSAGSTTAVVSIAVNPPPPSALSYGGPYQLLIGLPLPALVPTVTGTVSSYSVWPSLPPGLSFDASNGQVAGTPTSAATTMGYTITASNVSGSTSFVLSLQVVALTLEAHADVGAVELRWPAAHGATFELVRAEAPDCDVANYATCAGGTLSANVSPPHRQDNVENGQSYWFRVQAAAGGTAILSNEAGARPDQLTASGVRAIATAADGTTYLGGDFQSVGVRSGGGALIDATTGLPSGFPLVDGFVHAAIPDTEGGWYIGGDFLAVGGKPRYRLAHILADLTVDDDWSPMIGSALHYTGYVRSLALVGDVLYVAGGFGEVNGVPRSNVAAIGTDGALRTFSPIFDALITEIAVADDVVYIGGSFGTVNGQPRERLAALDSTGALQAWNPGANGEIAGLAVEGGVVYVGGTFTTLGGVPRNYLGAIGTNGITQTWNPAPNNQVTDLAVHGDAVYAAGLFTEVGGQARLTLAAIGFDGALRPWNPGFGGLIERIAVTDDTAYIGGQFTRGGPNSFSNLAAVALADGTPRAWYPSSDSGSIFALAASGDRVYVGGTFTHFRGTRRTRLAALRPDGTLDDWAPTADDTVNALAVDGTTVYVAGRFTQVIASNPPLAANRNRLAALTAAGALTSWNPGADGPVDAVALRDGNVYIGGEFTKIGGIDRRHTAAIGADGVLDVAWNPDADAPVRTLAVADDAIFVGGEFTTIGAQPRSGIALVGADGALRSWDAVLGGTVRAIAVADGRVYAGGNFTLPAPRQGLAAFDMTGALLPWNPGQIGLIYGIAAADGIVYFSGPFTQVLGEPRRFIAAIDADGILSDWTALAPEQNVFVVRASGARIHVGGRYDAVPAAP